MLVFLICKSRTSIAICGTPIQKLVVVGKWPHPPVFEVEKFRSALEKIWSRHAYTAFYPDDVSKPLHPKLWRWRGSGKRTSALFFSPLKTPKTKCQSLLNSQEQQSSKSGGHSKMQKIRKLLSMRILPGFSALPPFRQRRKTEKKPTELHLAHFTALLYPWPNLDSQRDSEHANDAERERERKEDDREMASPPHSSSPTIPPDLSRFPTGGANGGN